MTTTPDNVNDETKRPSLVDLSQVKKIWDGTGRILSRKHDQLFESIESARKFAEASGETLESLELVICEPVCLPELTEEDFYDYLPEDGEAPPELEAAMKTFNEAVAGLVTAWEPTEILVDLGGLTNPTEQ